VSTEAANREVKHHERQDENEGDGSEHLDPTWRRGGFAVGVLAGFGFRSGLADYPADSTLVKFVAERYASMSALVTSPGNSRRSDGRCVRSYA
jgi:hypothetical protein